MMVRWVDAARRFAVLVVAASVLATVGVAFYVADTIAIDTDTSDMLSPDLPFRRDSRALSEAFPQFSDNILIVVDGQTADLADDWANALAGRLRQRPELFGEVYDPAGDPFFRANGLLFLEVDELYQLSDRLAEAQPFLGALWHDPSLRGLAAMLSLAIEAALDEDGGPAIELNPMLEAMAEVVEAQAAGRFADLSWRQLMTGEIAEASDKRRFLLIQPTLDFASLSPAAEAMTALRSLAREMGLDRSNGVRMRLTGSAALAQEELASVEEGMGLAAAVSLVLVLALLMGGLRSARLVLATLATLVMGLIWTAGFALLALGQLNLISVAFAVLFIGLSVDFGIHFALRYKEETDRGSGHAMALERAAAGVGGALTLCAVAAAIAFYSFLPTAYLGLAELGLIAGTGMFVALFTNLTVLPALLTLMPLRPAGGGGAERGPQGRMGPLVRRHAGAVRWTALVLGLAAAAALPQARFDFDPMNLRDRSTESVSTLFEMIEDNRAGFYSITVLADDLDQARDLAAGLAGLDEVDSTETIADYVPTGQEEKLEIVSTLALFLLPSLSASERKPPPAPAELRQAMDALAAKLDALASRPGHPGARRLAAALSGLDLSEPAVAELERRLLSALPGRLEALRRSLNAGPVGLADLPQGVLRRQIAADGRTKVEVYPAGDVRQREVLAGFVAAVRRLAPNATGSPVIILEAGEAVVAAFAQAAVLAVACIVVLLAVLLRSPRDIALVFAPLILAALLTVAASVVFDIPFNFANVIVLPLLFGLGVAGAIHLVLRERTEGGAGAVLVTSTPRAVVFSALTTIGSFGSIALSSHPGTASMGILLTIAIALSLGCTLIVLPALMAVGRQDEGPA